MHLFTFFNSHKCRCWKYDSIVTNSVNRMTILLYKILELVTAVIEVGYTGVLDDGYS